MNNILTSLLFIFLFGFNLSCSNQSLNKKIESNDIDLLKEESLMRYNTNRLDSKEKIVDDLSTKALIACHQNKITKGLKLLENQMHSNKMNPFYWNALGTCYFLNKDFSKASFFYDLGLESIPSIKDSSTSLAQATLANNIGLIHLTFHRYRDAYNQFEKANSLLPDLFTPQFNMAQIYIEFNEDDKALQLLKKLELKNANDIDLLYSLSLIYFRKNDLDKSFATLLKIKSDYLNRPDIVGLYAYNLMKKNRLIEAQEIIEKRKFADEYDQRNKILLDEIKLQLKNQKK